ncbi:fumarylacetoacetate hydrolase family protein (plasmid) [Photobacterium sp. DA100]|uniref:fumarylacetoacetate hydrolase family protein n=1 Tax=Photobacterium sp. DA100 TaxID=3027472 RepID=UPI002478934F|nr:fumarylacetoacetate hydrolase family protein [Photobacterium sp. DA100]WEM44336.1 fumarylacetoacetate hydrolase family protein [Photobacterium sp. DA100]
MRKVNIEGQTVTPSKVVCVGRNYVAHIHELGNEIPDEMVLFIKPNSAISNTLRSSHGGDELHYEAELSFLYRNGRFDAVAVGLDLTKRRVQSKLKEKGLPWERSKAFDGSALFGEFVPLPPSERGELGLRLFINDKLTQSGSTSLMIYSPDVVLQEVQTFMSLNDGDIVMTGTPSGVGKVQAGSQFEAQVTAGEEVIVSTQWLAK